MNYNKDATELIQEFNDRFGESAREIIKNGLGLVEKGHNHFICPNPHEHKHGDRNPSMGWVRGKNYFFCQGCRTNIDMYSYYRKYLNYTFREIIEDGSESVETNRNRFISAVSKERNVLKQNELDYIHSRGITDETIEKFKLCDMNGMVGIPYYKNGALTGIKKRNLKEGVKNLSADGSKFFFFNFDNTEFDKRLIITEGEWDAMILDQCGFENVVSVGCGANAVSALFELADDYFERFPEIILFTDNDDKGNQMDMKFIDKFGEKIATVDKSLYNECKDANAIFQVYGAEQLKKIVNSGKSRFDGEWDLDDDPYTELDPSEIKFIKTGLATLDYSINCIQSKMVTLITGRSNAGKSTFVNQIISSAIGQNCKVFLALGEGNKDKVINKFYASLCGGETNNYTLKPFGLRHVKEPKPEVLKAIQKWHKGKLKLWVKALSRQKKTDELFSMLEYKARTEKFDLIVLDNQMSLLSVARSADKLEAQAEFVQQCHRLAISTNCAVILVLHPNKTYKKGEEMDFEQIAGTSDISNKADVILNVIRIPDSDFDGLVSSKVQVAKNRDESELPTIECAFDKETYTFAEVKDGTAIQVGEARWKKYIQKDNAVKQEFIQDDEEWSV
jgi:twinkle protein